MPHSAADRRASFTCLVAIAIGAFFAAGGTADAGSSKFGGFGPEGPRLREQFWVVPVADPALPLRATLFRPSDTAPLPSGRMPVADGGAVKRPLVVINHGTDELTRHAVAMPVFYWLSRWFVERGYAVLLPQRRGHGATGGALAEGGDFCRDPQHHGAGVTAAADIAAAIDFMHQQSFVAPDETVVVGISTGGWASLALAALNPPGVQKIVNFAGGRGGHAYGRPRQVCAEDRLVQATGKFGRTAGVPTLWLYASNDSFFGPELATQMAAAYQAAGAPVELHVLPAYGTDGHAIADDHAGWNLWGPALERFLGNDGDPVLVAARKTRAGL